MNNRVKNTDNIKLELHAT